MDPSILPPGLDSSPVAVHQAHPRPPSPPSEALSSSSSSQDDDDEDDDDVDEDEGGHSSHPRRRHPHHTQHALHSQSPPLPNNVLYQQQRPSVASTTSPSSINLSPVARTTAATTSSSGGRRSRGSASGGSAVAQHRALIMSSAQGRRRYVSLEKLSMDMRSLVNAEQFSDVKLLAGPERVVLHAHKCILSQRCSFFEACLNGEWAESDGVIEKPNVLPHIMMHVLAFLYTGEVEMDEETVFDLLAAADELQILDLKSHCSSYIKDTMNSENIFIYLESADRHQADDLKESCMMWIVDHAQIVFNSDSFLNVQLETLVYLLQNDDMEIEEDDVWRAVLRWGLHNAGVRSKDPGSWTESERDTLRKLLSQVFPHIRVLRITGTCFIEEVDATGLIPVELHLERGRYAMAPHKFPESHPLLRARGHALKFCWDTSLRAGHCNVSSDGKVVTLTSQGTATTFTDVAIVKGKQTVHIKIENIPVRTAYYVGIALEKSEHTVTRSLRDIGWGLQDNGRGVMHGGEFLNQEHGGRGVVYNTGDVVTMSVDKENGVLSYQINGEAMVEVTIEEIKHAPAVYLGVTMYNNSSCMRILDSYTKDRNSGLYQPDQNA